MRANVKKTGKEERVAQRKKSENLSSGLDRVEILKKAREREFREIRRLLEKVPDVREEKVAVLKAATEDEIYNVKGEEIAKKMIREGINEFDSAASLLWDIGNGGTTWNSC